MLMNSLKLFAHATVVAVAALAASTLSSRALAAPILDYSLPAAWDATTNVVTDQSTAGNNGTTAGTPVLSATLPPGAAGGTMSLGSGGGGFRTDGTALLTNSAIAAEGGFQYAASILWDGGENGFPVQKIIDYAGTESLQLENIDANAGTANLRFLFNDAAIGPVVPVMANTWYDVVATFLATGPVEGDGSLPGVAYLSVDGAAPVTESLSKTSFGDGLNRPIGIGTFSNSANGILNLSGFLYDPSVSLVPEPSTMALVVGLGSLLVLRRRS
jgi:hypothetical protein